ncbi:3D domain-containing protein [Candidatus Parcubacteria bacterium]|nr:3D domain-containing protein [Patescibacteria group bacterium]MBU4309567.1 3D domain-containing protein [Patescibacteria group bacterium]MBU4432508.1 3D domain-containing protein [Patescibacteria group bacterium]MBU4578045.1 3D domain-containing protein [Patescibacteria group bacterium]MCG2696447.1 3D domain-containing protein [Candidatus Parcubacteria bacterium]
MKSEFPIFRKKSIIPSFLADKIILSLIFITFFDFALFPVPILAAEINPKTQESGLLEEINNSLDLIKDVLVDDTSNFTGKLPNNKDVAKAKTEFHEMTAYTSEVAQCDASPCITANGFNVCKHNVEDTIAANFLKFGTKVKIPELYGDRVFIVRDRMNRRYPDRVDIWMKDKKQAIKFGFKVAKIEILE